MVYLIHLFAFEDDIMPPWASIIHGIVDRLQKEWGRELVPLTNIEGVRGGNLSLKIGRKSQQCLKIPPNVSIWLFAPINDLKILVLAQKFKIMKRCSSCSLRSQCCKMSLFREIFNQCEETSTPHFSNGKKISPSGNWTPVSRVTGGDTYHYTNEDIL